MLMEGAEGLQYQEDIARSELISMVRLQTEVVDVGEAQVAVHHAYIALEPKHHKGRNITIFLPGLPTNPENTTDQTPQETAFALETVKQTATDFIVLKPEGMNHAAFRTSEGSLTDRPTIEAAKDLLDSICEKHGIDLTDPDVKLSISGYSEGASQGASLAALLAEGGIHTSTFTGIEPAGVTGYKDPHKAKIFPASLLNLLAQLKPVKKRPAQKTDYGYHLSEKLIQSYNDILDGHIPTDQDRKQGVRSIVSRLKKGLFQGSKTPGDIQPERLKLALSENAAFDAMLENGTAVTFFSGRQSIVVPFQQITDRVIGWKQKYGNRVSLVSADITHFGSHENAKGVAFATALGEAKNHS